ncbi:hypothetical protein PAMP_006379 [Pampus punctatissimus]
MGSTLILKVRTCLKPFFHQGSSAFLTIKNPLVVTPTARFLCTRNTSPNPAARDTNRRNSRQTSGHGGGKHGTIGWAEKELWDGAVEGRGNSFYPRSVFTAGTAKRTAEMLRRKESVALEDEEQDEEESARKGSGKLQPPDRPLSAAEWREMKESLRNLNNFDIKMMIALFSSEAELDIAKSLLTFVAMETGTLSYKLLLKYLTLCVKGGHDAEVFDVYDIMRGSFSSLDTGASTLFIKAFSRTARWREAVDMLHEIKRVFTPSSRNYGDVITAAILNGDTTTAWALYDELIEKGQSPHQDTWEALFTRVTKSKEEEQEGDGAEVMSDSEHQERLLGILLYMRNNQIYPEQNLANSIKTWFESHTEQKWTGSWTKATPKGVCRCCGKQLESIQLTDEEYQQLKDRVMSDVIQGRDVFNKTTPEELERFKAFVKRKPAFDVVVDGLNVANVNNNKSKLSETLLAVVSELQHQGLNVLVLGRKHMLRPSKSWNTHHMKLIQQKAHCFFTENISEDDPFLLYASLHSGNHCRFVSRDLMRDHKACMSDGATRRLFFKWQRGHQLVVHGYVTAGRRVRFQVRTEGREGMRGEAGETY